MNTATNASAPNPAPLSIGETTKRFNQQVNRNLARFPPGFMFQLDEQEFANLRLQFATSSSKSGHGGRRYAPLASKVHTLERKVSVHERNIAELVDWMAELLAVLPPPPKRPIGFVTPEDKPQGSKAVRGKKTR